MNATAHGSLTRSRAESRSDAIKQHATVKGLRNMCTRLNLTQPQHKLSLFYIDSLKHMENLYMSEDYVKYWIIGGD